MHEVLTSTKLPKPRFHYTPVLKVGPLVRFSGMIALDAATGALESGGPEAEAAKILANLKGALPELGLRLDQLVSARIYTTRFEQFPAINSAWEAALKELTVPPTRTSVGVSALPLGASVEMEFEFFK
ncbi:MAG: RidA family protein [Proteobacteria bacterium]|nr:RidA family protein [Pseudomonadota bacterium]